MLGTSYTKHKTNEHVWQQVNILAGRHAVLLSTVKRRNLSWFGHVCHQDWLPKIILQRTVDLIMGAILPRKYSQHYCQTLCQFKNDFAIPHSTRFGSIYDRLAIIPLASLGCSNWSEGGLRGRSKMALVEILVLFNFCIHHRSILQSLNPTVHLRYK